MKYKPIELIKSGFVDGKFLKKSVRTEVAKVFAVLESKGLVKPIGRAWELSTPIPGRNVAVELAKIYLKEKQKGLVV